MQAPTHDLYAHHRDLGRDLGFEFARMGMRPPEDSPNPVLEGHAEGVHHLKSRRQGCIESTPYERRLLRLRLSAYRRARVVSPDVTAQHLQEIEVRSCPITRITLTRGTGLDTDATVDRIYNAGAYAAGNLMMMSMRANRAKGALLPGEILEVAQHLAPNEVFKGLDKLQWLRLACLSIMCEPITAQSPGHADKAPGKGPADSCDSTAQAGHHTEAFTYPPPGVYISSPYAIIQQALSHIATGLARPTDRFEREMREAIKGKSNKKLMSELMLHLRTSIKIPLVFDHEVMAHAVTDAWTLGHAGTLFGRVLEKTERADHMRMLEAAIKVLGRQCHRQSIQEANSRWALATHGYEPGAVAKAIEQHDRVLSDVADELLRLQGPRQYALDHLADTDERHHQR